MFVEETRDMSSTESKKNESLPSEEEKERMQNELLGLDMYEAGMNYEQMKSILSVINESKTMAINESSSSRNTRSPSPESSAAGSKAILPDEPEAQRIQERPKPSFSYKEPRRRSQAKSDASDIYDGFQPNEESVGVASEQVATVTSPVESPDENNTKTYSLRKRNKDPTDKSKSRESQDKCMFDPFFIPPNANVRPLQPLKRRFYPDTRPWGICKDPSSTKRPEETLERISQNLLELSTKLLAVQRAKAIPKEFEWGSPIKAGVEGFNLEESQYPDEEHQQVEAKSSLTEVKDVANSEDCRDRPSKRKAISLISSIDESGSDDSDEFVSNAAKKVKSAKPRAARKPSQSEENTESEDPSLNCLPKETEEMNVIAEENQEKDESAQYPRRVIPPSRGKRRLGPKFKSSSSKKTQRNAVELPNAPISEKQITIQLEQSDDELEVEENANFTEIKPLPIGKVSQKLSNASAHLKGLKEMEKRREKLELEKMKKEEEEKKRFKEENTKRIILLNEQKKREESKSKDADKEKQKEWDEHLRVRARAKKAEVKMLAKEIDDVQVHMEIEDAVEEVFENSNGSQDFGTCPICNKKFRMNKLEDHASRCYQYEDRQEEKTRTRNNSNMRENSHAPVAGRNTERHICQICDKFSTGDAILYEEHVNRCIRLREHAKSSASNASGVPITLAVSPPKCYEPLSRQPNSELSLSPVLSLKKGSRNPNVKRRKL